MAVVLLALPLLNCGLRAKAALREGHRLYKEQSFSKALVEYKKVLELDPANIEGTFYLGSSYHQLYVPGKDATKVNLEEAIKNYEAILSATAAPADQKYPILKKNALSALIGIYADDPYRDFEASLKYADQLTGSDPGNIQNLFAMANLYEKFGKIDDAETAYKKAVEMAPRDPKACGALATFYNKTLWDEKGVPLAQPVADGKVARGRFNDAVDQLKVCAELDPQDPKGYYTVATFYWDQCYRGPGIDAPRKKALADEGMQFVNKALAIKSDFVEALIYKGLLLREQAKLTQNPATRNSLMEEAQALQKKAVELKK
ncbi:MAG: tetratricopeptide repeat protein, partial [Vicinamibacteria bacterium]|nr:tetratricopeptide repeat protein [Vicinamibacteria bacterium]